MIRSSNHIHRHCCHPTSYGGHYAPAAGFRVFEGNNDLAPGDVPINLKAS
jgi:hypothetical protein